jgi:hypothetical protein
LATLADSDDKLEFTLSIAVASARKFWFTADALAGCPEVKVFGTVVADACNARNMVLIAASLKKDDFMVYLL